MDIDSEQRIYNPDEEYDSGGPGILTEQPWEVLGSSEDSGPGYRMSDLDDFLSTLFDKSNLSKRSEVSKSTASDDAAVERKHARSGISEIEFDDAEPPEYAEDIKEPESDISVSESVPVEKLIIGSAEKSLLAEIITDPKPVEVQKITDVSKPVEVQKTTETPTSAPSFIIDLPPVVKSATASGLQFESSRPLLAESLGIIDSTEASAPLKVETQINTSTEFHDNRPVLALDSKKTEIVSADDIDRLVSSLSSRGTI